MFSFKSVLVQEDSSIGQDFHQQEGADGNHHGTAGPGNDPGRRGTGSENRSGQDADGWADNGAGGRVRTVPSSPACAATSRPSRHE
ncbi:hypothetical protein [Streptomyces sp. NPDC059221]|uniref:hypothetical protein n=1 Tax=Streptomyces sp. NPDC059221 TaxID=3346774 RepID=UPI0036A6E3F9